MTNTPQPFVPSDRKRPRNPTWFLVAVAFLVATLGLATGAIWQEIAQAAPPEPFDSIWSSSTPVAQTATDSRHPSAAQGLDGTRYVAWEEGTNVYEARNAGAGWNAAALVASGEAPVVVVSDTIPFVIFENEIAANREIYAVRWAGSAWSLPRNVSATTGGSFAPDAARSPGGQFFVVWADNTSGSNALYLANSSDGVTWSGGPILINGQPVPGSAPALTIDPAGTLHVVWQDRDAGTGKLEVFYTKGNGTSWSLAENLSNNPGINSAFADVVADAGGFAYVVWEESISGGSEVYFTSGQPGNWSTPQNVSATGAPPSALPSLVRDSGGGLHVAWSEGNPATMIQYRDWPAAAPGWTNPVTVTTNASGIGDVYLLAGAGDTIYGNWAQAVSPTNWDIYDASGVPVTPTPTVTPTATVTPTPTTTPTTTPAAVHWLFLPLVQRQ